MSPYRPKHACAFPQCSEILPSGIRYCPDHKKKVSQQYEVTRETAVQRGYDTRHRKWRRMVLNRHPVCEECNRKPSTVAHHIDRNSKNRRIDNGQGLCKACHNRLHIKEGERWK